MRILGIDPALNITGFGIIDETVSGLCLIESGIVKTKSESPLPDRLIKIYQEISAIVNQFKPSCIILEKVYTHYRHPTTAYILGQARGIVCLICAQARLSLFEYAATRVKKAIVGEGLASKTQIQKMVTSILGLTQLPEYQDISDALALAIAHSYIYKTKRQMGI